MGVKGKTSMKSITYKPIGVIHSPFQSGKDLPIQAAYAKNIEGTVEVFPEYARGIKDLEQFSHLILICHFHQSKGYELQVKPFLDSELRGVFACRAPRRPNPIGISTVKLNEIKGSILHVSGLDIVDGTPLLDIKPYVPEFDDREDVRIGWLENRIQEANEKRADSRFTA